MFLNFHSRLDGRYSNQIRPIKIYNNPVNSSFSSVQLTIGHTSVIVSIFKETFDEENRSESVDINLYTTKPNTKHNCIKYQKYVIEKIINNLYPWYKLQMKILNWLKKRKKKLAFNFLSNAQQ